MRLLALSVLITTGIFSPSCASAQTSPGAVGETGQKDSPAAAQPSTVAQPAASPQPTGSVVAPAPMQKGRDDRPGIAVFPFFNGGSYGAQKEDLNLLQIGLQQSLMYELAQNTNLRVIDRSTLRELMQEQELGKSDRVDPATAARIGKIVGARYVVTGGFMDLFGDFQLTGRIVDVETTEIVRSAQVQGKRETMYGLVVDMASRVTSGIKLPALPAAVQESRKKRAVTPEAIVRHAMIMSIRDEGNTTRAVELYRDLVKDFPLVEEWKTELRQLSGT